ncbi:MAG: patatin-like phospholipase family protein [Vicinamibacteraceae bacterium]|nr:patatin-like phospholipase family protein [Vicinamibacteraceae bacterium]
MQTDGQRRLTRPARIGLALAGGGPEGAIYEIGVLRALDEAIDGLNFNALPVYVGVSAGALLAANLANGITPAQNVRAIVKHEPGEHPFVPQTFFTPAIGEFVRRGARIPLLLAEAVLDHLRRPHDQSVVESLLHLSQALPVGLFDNEPVRQYLERIYNLKDRTDDFRQLTCRLIIVACDLDSGMAVRFGEIGRDHVPISRAVQASSALPGLYSPVLVDGRHYVDGVLLKTLHASVALEAGADLVICINPIVPVDTLRAEESGRPASLTRLGLPSVLSQTFRTLIHSRMRVGIAAYAPRFPGQELVLFEPQPDDYRMFFTNIFSFAQRKAVAEYAYEATRRDLLRRFDVLAPIFERHGLRLRRDVLEDRRRNLWHGVGLEGGEHPHRIAGDLGITRRLDLALDSLDSWIAKRRHDAEAAAAAPRAAVRRTASKTRRGGSASRRPRRSPRAVR